MNLGCCYYVPGAHHSSVEGTLEAGIDTPKSLEPETEAPGSRQGRDKPDSGSGSEVFRDIHGGALSQHGLNFQLNGLLSMDEHRYLNRKPEDPHYSQNDLRVAADMFTCRHDEAQEDP